MRTRMTSSRVLSLSPSGASQLLSPGIESGTMTMARLLPRLVRFQGSGRCEGLAIFPILTPRGKDSGIAQHQNARAGITLTRVESGDEVRWHLTPLPNLVKRVL